MEQDVFGKVWSFATIVECLDFTGSKCKPIVGLEEKKLQCLKYFLRNCSHAR